MSSETPEKSKAFFIEQPGKNGTGYIITGIYREN